MLVGVPRNVKSIGPAGSERRRPAQDRIESHLRQLIADGAGVNSPLPSEESLAELFGVSRMTARVAYQRLARSGVIVRFPARGSFVAPHVVDDLTEWGGSSFYRRWRERDSDVELSILAYGVCTPPADVRAEFGPKVAHLTYLNRLRSVRGTPVSFDRLYMPKRVHGLIEARELGAQPAGELLAARGMFLSQGEMEIGARPADALEAGALGLHSGDIVIARRVLDRDAQGSLLIFEISVSPAARVGFKIRTSFASPERRENVETR